MDTSGFNQIGRYGTLSLLKKQSVPAAAAPAAESNAKPKDAATSPGPQVITSFGIDSANLTFGSSLQCDVRLYYPTVDAVHCRLINEDGKAFLVVQGKAGAFIDGSWVYPNTSSSSSSTNASEELQQTITPLANNSEFEIHSKRFRFTYPPKDVRRVLLATPVAQRNRTLRLSMIQSAQVFTPRPSKDPRENLKILQSPIKTSIFGVGSATDASARDRSTSPHKPRAVSPLKFGIGPDDESSDEEMDEEHDGEHDQNSADRDDTAEGEEEEHIVLAHTNHPRVVEEDCDLVILEDVPLHLVLPSPSVYATGTPSKPSAGQRGGDAGGGPPGTPTPMLAQPQPQSQLVQSQPPRTPPRRKSLGGTALHRAVLIRSAQRAVWRAEKEREEEEEEMEVLDAVVALGGKRSVEGEDDDLEMGEDEDDSEEDDEREQEQEDVEMQSVSDDSDSLGMENDTDEERDEKDEEQNEKDERKPLWKKSLERIIPWPFGAKQEDGEEEHVDDSVENEEEERADALENDEVPSLPVLPQQQTPIRRVLGSFMTPQARQPTQQPRKNIFPTNAGASSTSHPAESSAPIPAPAPAPVPAAGPGRYSLGGGEARRVLVQQPWRVKDLVVPPLAGAAPTPSSSSSSSTTLRAMDPPSIPDDAGGPGAGFPSAVTTAGAGASSASRITSARPSITQEERKAIQERRRSAVREVREDSFWKDGAPGMSPSKSRPGSSSPIKAPHGLGLGLGRPSSSGIGTPSLATPRRGVLGSPTKGHSLEYAIPEADVEDGGSIFLDKPSTSSSSSSTSKDSATPSTTTTTTNDGGAGENDDSESTAGLFERMRETVEDMKRRRSIATLSTPRTTLLDGEGAGLTAAPGSAWRESVVRGSVKKLDFTKITPAQSRKTGGSLAEPSAAAEVEAEATPTGRTQPDASSSSLFSKVLASKEDVENQDDDAENGKDTDEPEPFSLLRPGARASMSLSPKKRHEFDPPAPAVSMKENKEQGADAVMHSVPIVVVERVEEEEEGQGPMVTEEPEETEVETKTRGRTRGRPRLLRAPKEPQEVADEQPEEDEQEEHTQPKSKSSAKSASKTKPTSSSKPRSRTAKSPAPTPSPQTLEPEPSGSGPRRHRSRTPQPRSTGDEVDAASVAADVEQAPTRSGGRRATRKGTAEPEEPPAARRTTRRGTAEPEEPQAARRTARKGTAEPEEPAAVAPPKRKGRKAEPEPEPEPEPEAEVEEEVIEKVKPTPKRGRKPRAAATPAAAAIEEEDEAEDKEEVARAPATVKRGRSKKVAEPAAPTRTAQEDDDDEFDSYEVSTPAAAATTTTAKKPSRVPGRIPTVARGRKAAEVARAPEVEEEEEREEPVPLAATRGGRGGRANTLKTPAPSDSSRARIPASNAATTTTTAAGKSATGTSRKPRGLPKTPASAPAAAATTTTSTSAGDGEKENARSAGLSGSANASDEEPVTKVRISRKTAAATTGAVAGSGRATKTTASKSRAKAPKVEQNDDDALETIAAGKTRTTRIMRTRTKTG